MPTQRLTQLPDTVLRLIEKPSGPVVDTGILSAGLNSAIAARVQVERFRQQVTLYVDEVTGAPSQGRLGLHPGHR
ncbi:hypothetical protein [Streptomyces sp. NBC_00019]|uniref:hypothetical protein n=1 Tax=Streptomyces sp. NBC_00019 TaxID=2975623 RepID=UPI00324889CD